MSANEHEILRRLTALEDQADAVTVIERIASASGTWTPTIVGTANAGAYTYTRRVGTYVSIGTLVIAQFTVNISAITSGPTGDMRITGLPYTAKSLTDSEGGVMFSFIGNINMTAAALQLTAYVIPATSVIQLAESFDNAGGTNFPAANFTNVNAYMIGTAIYFNA